MPRPPDPPCAASWLAPSSQGRPTNQRYSKNAGVWVFGGGVVSQRASIVATDGTIADGPYPETKAVIGGSSIVDVSSRDAALEWAAKIAGACRCAQEVRELMPDSNV